jgi:hypothetical protein
MAKATRYEQFCPDAGVLMWDMRRRIDHAALPRGKCVIYFKYPDAPAELAGVV